MSRHFLAMANSSMAGAAAPRLRLSLVNDATADATPNTIDANADPPESQAESEAPADKCLDDANSPTPKPAPSGTCTKGGRARTYLQQEGQKASHVFAGLAPDPRDSSSESSESSASSEDEAAQSLCVAKPASIILDCPCPSPLLGAENGGDDKGGQNNKLLPFRYGGLELRTNSRSVEVCITEQSGEEKYVVTSRGVKDGESNSSNNGSGKVEWHKFVIVNRGGPATVTSVRIKMVSIKPAECDAVYVHACKVKAKLLSVEEARAAAAVKGEKSNSAVTTPQRAAPQAAASPMAGMKGMGGMAQMMMAMGGGGQQQQQQQPPSMAALMAMMGGGAGGLPPDGGGSVHTGIAGLPATPSAPIAPMPSTPSSSGMPSHADMGMAISALRTMVSSTEESINRRIIESTQQLDASMTARIQLLESKLAKLHTQVEEQNEIIMRQRNFIVEQGDAMKMMESRQNAMLEQILQSQNKLMSALESSRTAVKPQSDTSIKRGDEDDADLVDGEVRATKVEDCDPPNDANDKRQETRQIDSLAESQLDANNKKTPDQTDEASHKAPAMTYRGAENLLSFDEANDGNNNDLPSPEAVEDEAISDLLMSTTGETK